MKLATFYDHLLNIMEQEGISLKRALEIAKDLGIELLEVSANNIKMAGRENMKEQLEALGLGVSSVCAYFDFDSHSDVTEADLQILDDAVYLGAKNILIIPGFIKEDDSAEEIEQKTESMIKATAVVAEDAVKRGLVPVMEEYDALIAPFSTTAGVKRFLDGAPQLKVAFDTGNFAAVGEDVFDAYKKLSDRISHVHLKDRLFTDPHDGGSPKIVGDIKLYSCPVGFGDLRLREMIELIKADGYDDIFTLEFYDSPNTLDYLKRSVEFAKKVL